MNFLYLKTCWILIFPLTQEEGFFPDCLKLEIEFRSAEEFMKLKFMY